jgi:hypothetical protein
MDRNVETITQTLTYDEWWVLICGVAVAGMSFDLMLGSPNVTWEALDVAMKHFIEARSKVDLPKLAIELTRFIHADS